MMLGRLESMSLQQGMKKIKDAMASNDYENMNCGAHTLKGSSGYVGASRIHYACYYIQEAFVSQQYDVMYERYPALVEAAIEFKRFSRKILAGVGDKVVPYEESKSARETELADGYRIQFDPTDDRLYCLKGN